MKEKETYKKAREILERFSTGVDIQRTPPTSPLNKDQSIMQQQQQHQQYPNSTPCNLRPNNNLQQLNDTTSINNSMMRMNQQQNSTLVHRNVKQIKQQNMSISQGPQRYRLDKE